MKKFDLVAFDVDGTLVEHEEDKTVWEVFNRRFTGDDGINKERLQAYKDGRLSYADWVTLDIESWRVAGARRDDLVAALEPLRLVGGTHEALATLKEHGVRLAVISGTLDILLDMLLPEHPFDEIYCNRIRFNDDGTIHSWIPTPFDMQGKETVLRAIALREGYDLARCAFVGDSSNDIWIARQAGFTVGFNPKTAQFEEVVDVVVRSGDLREILPHLLDD